MVDTFGKENRYRPLFSIGVNSQGRILLLTSLAKGTDDRSAFTFQNTDLSIIPDKFKIETENQRLNDLYVQLVKTPEITLTTFLLTALAYNGFIFNNKPIETKN